jgi:hypothetical protein
MALPAPIHLSTFSHQSTTFKNPLGKGLLRICSFKVDMVARVAKNKEFLGLATPSHLKVFYPPYWVGRTQTLRFLFVSSFVSSISTHFCSFFQPIVFRMSAPRISAPLVC